MAIYLGRRLPGASSDRNPRAWRATLRAPSYLVLLRTGFAWPAGHPAAGGLLPHHFTLTGLAAGGVISVALSFGSPRLGVTQRPALWSPDFPPHLLDRRWSGHPTASTDWIVPVALANSTWTAG